MTVAQQNLAPDHQPQRKRFMLEEYLRMAEAGFFIDQRTEFIDGEILHMPPQKNFHVYAVSALTERLLAIVQGRHWVRTQATLKIGQIAAPDPDVAVVQGPKRADAGMPDAALFVAEVSDTTLRYDRTTKASLYALARVPEYWIVNLVDRRVEVHREPVEDHTAPFGWRYGRIESLDRTATLALPSNLDAPGATIAAAEFLP
jgi:Uma2 family endonuclease